MERPPGYSSRASPWELAWGLFVVELRARRAQDDKTAAVVRENVADASQQQRRMRDVGVEDAGVHRATEHVAYVPREVEPEVERLLRAERRVLIVGPSMSGKTRLALRVTKHLYADHWLLVPRDGKALHALLAAGVTGTELVIWLDNLDDYLGSDGLTTDVLDRFHEQGNVVVATIRSVAYKALLPVGDLRPAGSEAPGWFGDRVWLVRWTEDELNRVPARVPAKVLAGAQRHGLSAYLGGGPLARDWLHTGETTDPLGYALVRIAADWRRVGLSSPTPRTVLVALAPAYTATARPRVDEEAVRQGLEWATKKINDTVALLETVNGGYSVLDYILDDLAAHHPPIPRQT